MNDSSSDRSESVERRHEARSLRLVGRQALRRITTDLRCYDCGREPIAQAVGLRRTSEGVVGFAGLASCGRVWLCPVCNAKVMARRSMEIGAALAWSQRGDIKLVWGSLTVRHNMHSDLAEMLELQRAAWRIVVSSKWWRSLSATATIDHGHTLACAHDCERKRDTILLPNKVGRIGYIRASELTYGANGWHPHFHPLVFWRGPRAGAQAFADRMVIEWVHAVESLGGEARIEGGQQLRVLSGAQVVFDELGSYVTKQTFDHSALALELVWSQNKTRQVTKGRAAKTLPHWSLLAEIALGVGNHIAEVDRWQELEEASPGHRMITWSRGLRAFAGIGAEIDDETIAAEEAGTALDTVCFITPDGWAGICDNPALIAQILYTLEVSGWPGARVLLDTYGVEYFTLVDEGVNL